MHRAGSAWLLAALLLSLGCESRPPADRVLVGRFLTLDPVRPLAEALAVRDERIVAIGSAARVAAFAGPSVPRERLPGVALPGFAEGHGHVLALGEQLERLDLRGLALEQVLERVRSAAASARSGEWVLGQGWDQGRWSPPAFPTAAQLDAVAPEHPVLLTRIDLHSAWLNGMALERAGIDASTPDPPGGRILRDASGRPSGIVVDAAYEAALAAVPEPGPARIAARMRAALERYLRWGVTSVHDAGIGRRELAVYERLDASGELPLRLYALLRGEGESLEKGLARGPWDSPGGRLSVRGFKLMLDGALGSRGAQLAAPYADEPGARGLVLTSDIDLAGRVQRATRAGFQVAVHAIGDRAVRRALDAFEAGGRATRRLRPRIEHVSVVDPVDLPRFARLGVIASLQPNFVGEYGRWAIDRVGPQRIAWVYPTRQLLDSGARIAAGTDFPAADTGDPIVTLDSLVTRRGSDGEPAEGFLPGERIDVGAALLAMTRGPAWAAFQEDRLGALTVGRYADLTLLSADPHERAPERLRELRVLATFVGGVRVYSEP